jgi:hypothetical protein
MAVFLRENPDTFPFIWYFEITSKKLKTWNGLLKPGIDNFQNFELDRFFKICFEGVLSFLEAY